MNTPWHQRTWIVVALIIFFFPVGLVLAWRHPTWPKAAKWIATGVVVIAGIGAFADKGDQSEMDSASVAPVHSTQDSTEANSLIADRDDQSEMVNSAAAPVYSSQDIIEARSLIAEVRELIATGRSMENLRNTEDLDLIGECGETMRAAQARLKEIDVEADALSLPSGAIFLDVAAKEGISCVWCLDGAIEMCDQAIESLTLAEETLDELEN